MEETLEANKCTHCWHGTGMVLTSHPPQIPEICCWCGEHRIRPKITHIGDRHGKFFPNTGTVAVGGEHE